MDLSLKAQKYLDQLPWRISGPVRKRFPPKLAYYHVFTQNPLIILIPEDIYDDESLWAPFFAALGDRKVHFICLVRGPIEATPSASPLAQVLARHRAAYPKHEFTFLANNSKQLEMFKELNAEAVICNQNALVDERLFDVIPDSPKKYDAIYNARVSPYKRHYLATRIASLALVTVVNDKTCKDYFAHITEVLPQAAWLNFKGQLRVENYKMIPQAELGKYLNQAKVGLCVSASEGAMFASIEYLLCGLPVLSTPSVGGRDAFFDSDCAEIADDTPEALGNGLRALLARLPPPAFVRQKTLQRMGEHRAILADVICRIFAKEGLQLDAREALSRLFPEQIYKLRPLHQILSVR